ncbi:hypothetical protein SDRG_17119 [Saprolegnia diclina VS20]|uniref:Uncharacterized protein n=1 Tax=Saprolegnia diclina (strain VS20) TaxID=1156394 RepID=T0PI25_SAPDV|nr:hypothetical protein SDRG_17119 [Saprolegnia diclina VS20]EQC24999.1 hypothetical protein SDRG_17119 [Saprolegnia diclina VS20]|eukprot:XP_008621576.1 hypothetical protein SDRG_17119 [Saprolegnia diclina VS20]
MAAQRPRLATTSVLDITCVPVLVVQCIASSDDVASFLQAMPAAVLTPELVALRELMTAPDAQPHYYWPTMHLTMTTDFEVDRIVTAMPIVPRASFRKLNVSQRSPASKHPDIRLPFCAFVATWALKFREVTISATDLEEHRV